MSANSASTWRAPLADHGPAGAVPAGVAGQQLRKPERRMMLTKLLADYPEIKPAGNQTGVFAAGRRAAVSGLEWLHVSVVGYLDHFY